MEYKVPNLYPKQEEFCKSKTKYTCYGGARGGGKSFVARIKAILLALYYPGIQILLLSIGGDSNEGYNQRKLHY